LQAVIAELHTTRLRHSPPERYCKAVPTAQAPLQTGRSRQIQTQALVAVRLNLALSQCNDGDVASSAVQAERGQLCIVSVGGNDQDPALGVVRIAHRIEGRIVRELAETPSNVQAALDEQLVLTGKVEVTPPCDTALEILTVLTDPYLRVAPAP